MEIKYDINKSREIKVLDITLIEKDFELILTIEFDSEGQSTRVSHKGSTLTRAYLYEVESEADLLILATLDLYDDLVDRLEKVTKKFFESEEFENIVRNIEAY